jgi:hypothetical protein
MGQNCAMSTPHDPDPEQGPQGQGEGGQSPPGQGGQSPYGQGGQSPYGQGGQPPYGQGGQPPYGQGGQSPYGQGGQPPYGQGGQPPYDEGGQSPYGQGGQSYGQGGQSPYGQSSYGQDAGSGQPYGQGAYAGGYGAPVANNHPQGTTILVLGILGILICGVLAVIAWVMGNRAMKEIDANPAAYSNRQSVSIGRVLGIVGTILWALGILAYIIFFVVLIGSANSNG